MNTLQSKFAMLICMLGAIVIICIGAVMCSFVMLQREVASPIISMASVLKELGDVKHQLGRQEMLFSGEGWTDDAEKAALPLDEFEAAIARCLLSLDRLESLDSYNDLAGSSTSRQLRHRIESVASLIDADPTQSSLVAAADEAGHAVRLIDRIEGQIAQSAAHAHEYAATLSQRLTLTLIIALTNAVLMILLSFLLLSRWVVRPVQSLRRATSRLAMGDFQHRVDVTGQDELAQLCAELNRTSEAVAAMQEARLRQERLAATGEMARRLAHNLRNPLAGIRSLAELTRSGLDAGADEVELQTRIITTVDHFDRWLAGLLDATSPLSFQPELTDVESWLDGVVESHRAAAESHSIEIRCELDGALGAERFDPLHLEHAVVALLSNAIEATPRGGRVRVHARMGERGKDWEILVEDSGPGVASGLEGRIFFPSFSTKRGGRGIGLAVAQQVVFGHGGEIVVEPTGSAMGGAAFMIRLPRVARAKPGPARRPRPQTFANGSAA